MLNLKLLYEVCSARKGEDVVLLKMESISFYLYVNEALTYIGDTRVVIAMQYSLEGEDMLHRLELKFPSSSVNPMADVVLVLYRQEPCA